MIPSRSREDLQMLVAVMGFVAVMYNIFIKK
jgi:hypothetical protein